MVEGTKSKSHSVGKERMVLEEHLNWLLRTVPGFSYRCLLDEHWTMLVMTDRVQSITGYPAAEFIHNATRSFESIIHPDDSARVTKTVEAAVKNNEVYLLEYRLVARDGTLKRVLEKGGASRGRDGKVAWLDGYIVDQTEYQLLLNREQERKAVVEQQQNALVELATSHAVGEGLLEQACELATGLVSRASGVARASLWLLDETRTQLRLVDLYQQEDQSHQSGLVLSASDYPSYFEAMASGRLVDANNAQTDPRTCEFAEGYLKPLNIGSMLDAALRASGEVVGVLCMEHLGEPRQWRDVEKNFAGEVADQISLCLLNRARQQARAQQEELQEQLFRSQKLEAVGRLAGGIAHDFNNLLTIIGGFAEKLSETLPRGEETEDLQEIITATQRASDLTAQLLTFSRKENVKLVPMNITASVGMLQRMLDRLISDNIRLQVDVPEQELFIEADEGLVHQMLTNLVVNAQDAIAGQGQVQVSLKEETLHEERTVEGGALDPGSYVLISVRDSGAGIPIEILPNIFEPFFTTKAAGSGTGLGLSTVYGIVRRCGGALRVTSQLGEGTCFELYFPSLSLRLGTAPDSEPAAPHSTLRGAGRRILVAEDNSPVLELIARSLGQAGFKIIRAPGTSEALELLQKAASPGQPRPALILSDMAMPGGGGSRILTSRNQHFPQVPIAFISGYMTEQEARLVEDFPRLQKPFSAKDLLAFVETVLKQHESIHRETALSRAD